MKTFFRLVSILFSVLIPMVWSADLQVPERGFISSRPGETWEQGLICGNGIVGASVLSRPLDETVVFSHERLFLPEQDPLMPPHTAPRLFEIRRLIQRGLYRQASQLTFDISEQDGFRYPDPFVPAFDLKIRMDAEMQIKDYMRSTNFQTGEATVHWADNRGVFERKLFVSRADGIAVLSITGPGKGSVNCRLELKPRDPDHARFRRNISDLEITADESSLTYRNNFANAYPGSIHTLEGVARVIVRNGSTTPDRRNLVIRGADEVLVFIDITLLYDSDESRIEQTKKILAELPADYENLLKRHVKIHGALFNRMRLDLGGGADHRLTSEELLAKTSDSHLSRALIEKEFDAGRYNIISSTGELPPNLQGVWAGTYDPPWASDFTQNGNVPSAIASLLMGNMPELMLAYTSYIESIVPYLEINADRIFGARGIVLPSRTSTNGFNNSFNASFPGAFWVAGAAWAAHFFYDYYLYTGDRVFLAQHALPFMEKAALFFEDYLIEDADGKYMFIPTQSPENAPSNTKSQSSLNATMSVAAAKELLGNLIEASRELGINQQKIPLWQAMLEKMPAYMINEDGAVKEWLTPKLEDNYDHRHSSQLYPLYDGMPDEIAQSPELQAAFKRVIELKLERHWTHQQKRRGFMSFGLVQLGQAATSLEEADLAYRCLIPLVNHYWLHNLASMHNYKSLFNMDISGGMPAVIIKMLVASDPGKIQLLPALPDAWPKGTIEGVLCRGQIEIKSLQWEKDRILVSVESGKKQQVIFEVPSNIRDAMVRKGQGTIAETDKDTSRLVSLLPDQEVTIEFILR
jgi:alpha-L-fucosidase 2